MFILLRATSSVEQENVGMRGEIAALLKKFDFLPAPGASIAGISLVLEVLAREVSGTNLGDLTVRFRSLAPSETDAPELLQAEREACQEMVQDENPGVRENARNRLNRLDLPPVPVDGLAGHKLRLTQLRRDRKSTLEQITDAHGCAVFRSVFLNLPCSLTLPPALSVSIAPSLREQWQIEQAEETQPSKAVDEIAMRITPKQTIPGVQSPSRLGLRRGDDLWLPRVATGHSEAVFQSLPPGDYQLCLSTLEHETEITSFSASGGLPLTAAARMFRYHLNDPAIDLCLKEETASRSRLLIQTTDAKYDNCILRFRIAERETTIRFTWSAGLFQGEAAVNQGFDEAIGRIPEIHIERPE